MPVNSFMEGDTKMAEPGNIFEDAVFDGSIGNLPSEGTNKRLLAIMAGDATKSMEGESISQLNYGMQELVPELQRFASDYMVDLDLGILSFTNSIRWEMEPMNVDQCIDVPPIHVRPGLTQYGVVYHELNKMLAKDHLLKHEGKQAAPVIIFMTDGAPTDDYRRDLEVLKKNTYFAQANRAAIILGEGANDPRAHAAVEEFVSSPDMILTVEKHSELVGSIKLATLRTLKQLKECENDPKPDLIG